MFHRLIAAVSLCFVAACTPPSLNNLSNIGKESDPTRFYTLAATAEKAEGAVVSQPVLGVGPVSVADYLDRSHIVVRESDNQLELADFDRWAGNPAKEIQRVTIANLATLLGNERVVGYPWKSGISPDMAVEIAIERFEYGADGKAWLVASWQVYADGGREAVAFRRSTLSRESGSGYEDIAGALSALSGELATQIADAMRSGYRPARNR